jgi:predicted nucleic acid-binding protein
VEKHVFDDADPAVAPDLVNVEVLHTLRRLERRRYVDTDRIGQAREDLASLPMTRYPTADLIERAWELRHNFTPYDAAYIALAEVLEAPLVTADRHLAQAIPSHTTVVVVTLP